MATQKHACEAFHKVASITWRWGWLKGEDLSLIHVNHFAPAHFQKKITLVLNIVFVSIINSFLKDKKKTSYPIASNFTAAPGLALPGLLLGRQLS